MKTAIVTDTNSGIFPKEGRLLGVYVLPMPLQIDGRTYYEGKDISVLQFYEYLAQRPEVSTSQPAPGDVLALWDHALEECDELVYIPMSSGLSSSCHTAQALAKEYDGKVHVVNNHRISLPLRNSVLDAKALANAGCTAAEIKEELERSAYDSITYIGVETLDYLKRGGRVTAAGAALGAILNIKPLLKIEGGKLDACARVRGTDNCKKRLIEEIDKSIELFTDKGWDISVDTADSYLDPASSGGWLAMASNMLFRNNIAHSPLTCSIGCHVGPNAFGMAVSRRLMQEG